MMLYVTDHIWSVLKKRRLYDVSILSITEVEARWIIEQAKKIQWIIFDATLNNILTHKFGCSVRSAKQHIELGNEDWAIIIDYTGSPLTATMTDIPEDGCLRYWLVVVKEYKENV